MEKTTKTTRIGIRDICYISLFSAIISVMAQISIPLPGGVPLTLQTLAVMLAGLVLGARRGALAAVVYVLLAALGAPVLANMTGGAGAVFGVTGGFILSFPVLAFLSGTVSGKSVKDPLYWIGLLAGVLLNYAAGAVWFMAAAGTTLKSAASICILPFIPTDILKLILSGLTGDVIKKTLRKGAV